MQPGGSSDDLVVSTPERVAFQYEIAGIGSRFLAQVVDVVVISVIQLAILLLAGALGGIFNSGALAGLVVILLSFILLVGYFLISEAAWNGQTLGKRVVRLRVVGDLGQPLSIGQAAIRNLVRIIDFLPVLYAVGIVTMFSNRRSKRLGDFAAGTLVVRDRERINLYDLSNTAVKQPPSTEAPASSIWSQPVDAPAPLPSIWSQPAGANGAPPQASVPETVNQTLDPGLRKLVVAYAGRRESLPKYRREALARSAEPALRNALPDVVAAAGPLAALDTLAEREGVSTLRVVHKNVSAAMAWGITSVIFLWFVVIGLPTGILAIFFASRGLRAIRNEPEKYQGADRAKTARVLGYIGAICSGLIGLLILLAIIFRTGS